MHLLSPLIIFALGSSLLFLPASYAGGSKNPTETTNEAPASSAYISSAAQNHWNALLEFPSKSYGLEMLELIGDSENLATRFGHVMLRILINKEDPFQDIVINFYPDHESPSPNSILSAFPHYELGMEVNTLGNFIRRYIVQGNRKMLRIPILSTPALRTQLILEFDRLATNPQHRGKYTLLNRNCLGILIETLERAGFPRAANEVFLPTNTRGFFQKIALAPFDALPILNRDDLSRFETDRHELVNLLRSNPLFEDSSKQIDPELAWALLIFEERETRDQRVYHQLLESAHGTANPFLSRAQAVGVAPLPSKLYNLCYESSCAYKLALAIREHEIVYEAFPQFTRSVSGLRYQQSFQLRSRQMTQQSRGARWQNLKDDLIFHYHLLQEQF